MIIISNSKQPLKHYFVLSNQNILQAQRLMQSAWGLQWLFYREPEGQIVWQPLEETERFNSGGASTDTGIWCEPFGAGTDRKQSGVFADVYVAVLAAWSGH